MKLQELYIAEFGSLKDLSLKPGSGLTVIHGENESGKSTVWLFIKFILYGLPKRGSVERERAISRDGHRAAGRMLLQNGEEVYQIERSVVEGGRTSERVSVTRVRDGELCFAGEIPGEALLGVPKEVFESSCGIGQMMCTGINGKKEAAAIRNLLVSADETVEIDKIEAKLEEIRVRFRHRKGSGGRLYELEKEIHEQKQRLDRATEHHLRKAELAEKLESGAAQLRFCEQKLAEAEAMQKEIAKLEVLRRFDALRANEEKLLQLRREREELAARECKTGVMPTAMDVTGLRLTVESLKRAELAREKAVSARQKAEEAAVVDEGLLSQAEQMKRSGGRERVMSEAIGAQKRATMGKIGIAVGAVLAVAGVAFFAILRLLPMLILCLLGVFLATAAVAVCVTASKRAREISAPFGVEVDALDEYLRQCEESLEQWEKMTRDRLAREAEEKAALEQEQATRATLEDLLSKYNPGVPPTVGEAWSEMQRLDAFLRADAARQQQERTLSQLVENDRHILAPYREEELRAGLTVSSELSAEGMARAKRDRNAYAEKVRLLRNQEEQLRNELISRNAVSEDPMILADELTKLQETLRADTFYYEAVEGALDGLRQAGEALRGNLTPMISRNAGNLMDYVTDGRYDQMRVAGTMTLSLVEENQAATVSELLSGGTRDAAYLSLRIALMMQLYGEELPPLMMDETLCQLDDRRMKRILSLLGKLAEDGLQCLLFTCHRRELEACRELGIEYTEILMDVTE